jgi:GT2 family glycosyltransferase
MTGNNPMISIIIPVLYLTRPLNKKRFFMPRQTIADLLSDIKKNVREPHEVIVVCNGTDTDLRQYVQESPDITRYCLNSVNVGVARAWNMGAQLAAGDLLCYLNDDVSVGAGALESLSEQLRADPGIGQIGPAGSYWRDCQHDRFAESEGPIDVDVVSGFCFMLRAATFHQLGGFDVAFTPAGCEEIDLSYRIRQAGLRCVVDPRPAIKHFHHHGVSAHRTEIHYMGQVIDTETLHTRNSTYFRQKWNGVFP